MKKFIKSFSLIVFMMFICITFLSLKGVAVQATEVGSESSTDSEETPTEESTEAIKPITKRTIKGITYEIVDKNRKIARVIGSEKNIKTATVLPTVNIDGTTCNVTIIMPKAFAKRKLLKKVTIGKNIKVIANQVFYKDAKLKTVVFKGKNVIVIGKNTFKGTYKSIKVKIPKKVKKKYVLVMKKAGLPKKAKIVTY